MNQPAKPIVPPPVIPNDSDEALMTRTAAGDVAAFRTLYDKYKGPIVNYLIHMVRQKPAAEEIAQEVFLRVFRKRETYTVEAKFTTWLWTIARNAGLDYLRKKTEVIVETDLDLMPVHESDNDPPEAEKLIIERSTRAAIEKCMDALTIPQREALTMRTFSELSYDEIGETLKLSLSGVKSLLHRAKQGLLDCLKGGGYGR